LARHSKQIGLSGVSFVICGFDLDGNHAAVDLPRDAVAYLD
jgi:hypothetical protein